MLREEHKRELIREIYSLDNVVRIDFNTLTFREKVYLGALLRFCLSNDLSVIEPTINKEVEYAPTNFFANEILGDLIDKQIIVVDPRSSVNAFTSSGTTRYPMVFFTDLVHYQLNVKFNGSREQLIDTLVNPSFDIENNYEALEVWREIAFSECCEYFQFSIDSVGFNSKHSE